MRMRAPIGGNVLEAAWPVDTVVASVSGDRCFQDCAHCGGHYLKPMKKPEEAIQMLRERRAGSILVSGGCDRRGAMDLRRVLRAAEEARRVAPAARINVHLGLQTEDDLEMLEVLSRVVDAACFDLVVAEPKEMREIYGPEVPAGGHVRALRLLARVLREKLVPHVCLGVYRGQIRDEESAFQEIARAGCEQAVVLVFRPTPGSRFEGCRPPDLDDVSRTFRRAREILAAAKLRLGCMRPGGRYRTEVDRMAVEAGFDGIVNPVPSALRRAAEMGAVISEKHTCCVL